MSLVRLGQAIIKNIANKKIKIGNKVEDLKSKFATNGLPSCPTTPELLKIINQRNELLKILTQLKKQVSVIDKAISPLSALISALNTAATALQVSPIPSAVSGVGIPIGVIVSAGDALSIVKTQITGFKATISSFDEIVDYILRTIEEMIVVIKALDILIEGCARKASQTASETSSNTQTSGAPGASSSSQNSINNSANSGNSAANNLLLNNLLNIEDSNLINRLQDNAPNDTNTYKGFVLGIVLDDKNDTRFPKRYAIAKTPSGVIVLRGESSFSSSVDVLLDEIRFIIDRDNLTL